MTTNFLYAQAPNRKGNVSKHTPASNTGVTAVTGANKRGVAQPSGSQGAPKVCCDATCGRGQKVAVDRPKAAYGANDGYRNSSYLK